MGFKYIEYFFLHKCTMGQKRLQSSGRQARITNMVWGLSTWRTAYLPQCLPSQFELTALRHSRFLQLSNAIYPGLGRMLALLQHLLSGMRFLLRSRWLPPCWCFKVSWSPNSLPRHLTVLAFLKEKVYVCYCPVLPLVSSFIVKQCTNYFFFKNTFSDENTYSWIINTKLQERPVRFLFFRDVYMYIFTCSSLWC